MYADEQDRISSQGNQYPTGRGRSRTSSIIIDILVFGILAAIAAYVYYVLTDKDVVLESSKPSSDQHVSISDEPATNNSTVLMSAKTVEPTPKPLVKAEVELSYGLPEEVPELNTSDDLLQDQLRLFPSLESVVDWSQASDLARRFVALVYNMAEGSLPHKYLPLVALEERFSVIKKGGLIIDPKSYQRYDIYAEAFSALDSDHVAAVYRYFWPVFQKAFQELGEPKKSLHLETLKAIEHVASSPVIEGDVRLVQPAVYYQFADPELEKLTALQKQMIRMGPKNSALVITKLEEIKAAITSEI